MIRAAFNLLAFQIGWLACVIGAARGHPTLGTLVACALVGAHLVGAAQPRHELRLVALALGLGILLDGSLAVSGWLLYASGFPAPHAAPHWILAMWALFATTLTGCLRWLQRSVPLAALLGAAGGPASYVVGARLGGVELVEPAAALATLAAGWAIALPVLVRAADLERGTRVSTPRLTIERC